MFFSVNTYITLICKLSVKAKRILLESILLWGYIFTSLAVSYALAHRMGKQSVKGSRVAARTRLLGLASRRNTAITVLKPQGLDFLTHSTPPGGV